MLILLEKGKSHGCIIMETLGDLLLTKFKFEVCIIFQLACRHR